MNDQPNDPPKRRRVSDILRKVTFDFKASSISAEKLRAAFEKAHKIISSAQRHFHRTEWWRDGGKQPEFTVDANPPEWWNLDNDDDPPALDLSA